jgi:heme-degrading monooxygenase HmoA
MSLVPDARAPLVLGQLHLRERQCMFTRVIEVNLKQDTKPAFFKKFRAEVLPILKKTPGFFDVVVLENETDVNKVFAISFWETKKNVEYYEKEWYPKVNTIFEPFFNTPPVVKHYTVEETFSEKLFTKVMV